ncbi:MAG: type VI secretion system contractile sheath large subunit [Gammaproteobacteria bacterium]|nr:type VI secretion system contractile sheath large subunit [Gammaproteobacteria bacterium]
MNTLKKIKSTIYSINEKINSQLDTILHHKKFQQLEASWRGFYLLIHSEKSDQKTIKIKLLNVTWDELKEDVFISFDYDQTALFEKLHNKEFDHPGGEPIGLLLCDYYFQEEESDFSTLSILSKIAAASFSPIMIGAASNLFTSKNNTQSPLKKITHMKEFYFLSLIAPRIIMRLPHPYHPALSYLESNNKKEDYLWGNSVYFSGINILQKYAFSNWFLEYCSAPSFFHPLNFNKYSTEMRLTQEDEKKLGESGISFLNERHDRREIVFSSIHSLYQEKSRKKFSFNHILCFSRFAHYIKSIGREKIGVFSTPAECEKFIKNWLQQYTADGPNIDDEYKTTYPLKKTGVHVSFYPGDIKKYHCEISLSLHLPTEMGDLELKISTEIPR